MQDAKCYLAARVQQYKQSVLTYKLAIVLDIDDTSLSHYHVFKNNNFAITPQVIDSCYRNATSPAINPILDFYEKATEENISVFFITARKPLDSNVDLLPPTIRNLQNVGYTKYTELFLPQGNDAKLSTVVFKTNIRQKLEKQGYKIILNIGDQKSDFEGGYAERAVAIPNQLYDSSKPLPDLFKDSENNTYLRSKR